MGWELKQEDQTPVSIGSNNPMATYDSRQELKFERQATYTIPQRLNQNPYGPLKIKQETAKIDHLSTDYNTQYLEERESEKDEWVDKAIDLLSNVPGKFDDRAEKFKDISDKVFAFHKLVNDASDLSDARQMLRQAKTPYAKEKARKEYDKAKSDLIDDATDVLIDLGEKASPILAEITAAPEVATFDIIVVLQNLAELSPQYLAQRLLQIRKELADPRTSRGRRISLQKEYRRLMEKFLRLTNLNKTGKYWPYNK